MSACSFFASSNFFWASSQACVPTSAFFKAVAVAFTSMVTDCMVFPSSSPFTSLITSTAIHLGSFNCVNQIFIYRRVKGLQKHLVHLLQYVAKALLPPRLRLPGVVLALVPGY